MKIALNLIAAISLLSAGAAYSKDALNVVTTTIKIQVSDLNLASAEGQATLNRRVAGAIRRVCPLPDARVLMELSEHQRCVANARAAATQQVAQLKEAAAQFAATTTNSPTARLAP